MAKVGLNRYGSIGGFFSDKKRSSSASSVASSSSKAPSPFQVLLDDIGYKESRSNRSLENIFLELGESERTLLDNPKPENVSRYRSLISEIINKILKENCKIVSKRSNSSGIEFSTVRIIHQKLDYLIRGLTSHVWEDNVRKTNPAFELLKTMGDIRGLLVNLQI